MNDNSNDDINMMAKYFVHSSKIQNESNNQNDVSDLNNLMNKDLINNQNINQNMNNFNANMNSMNTSFESTMTNQMNLNNEIMNEWGGLSRQKINKTNKNFQKKYKIAKRYNKKKFLEARLYK